MDWQKLLDLSSDLGYGLLESGAEIYRVEESVGRLLLAYGAASADPFVIPNCIFISFMTPDGTNFNRVRRMPTHGTDIDKLERYNDLCRTACREKPSLAVLEQNLEHIAEVAIKEPVWLLAVAYFLVGAGFTPLFGGTVIEALAAGICGALAGLAFTGLSSLKVNLFLKSMLAAAVEAFTAFTLLRFGFPGQADKIIIGAIMVLTPGMTFTNAIRDVMAGDIVAGLIKIADAVLTGVSIAMGTAFAMWLMKMI